MGNISLLQFISSVTTMHCANEETENKRLVEICNSLNVFHFKRMHNNIFFYKVKGQRMCRIRKSQLVPFSNDLIATEIECIKLLTAEQGVRIV